MSRKFIAVLMTAVIMLCGMTFTAFADDTLVATLGFADSTWKAQDWVSSCVVTGDGTYSITANCVTADVPQDGSGVSVMTVNFTGLWKQLGNAASKITVSDVKVVTGGGASLAIDQSKVLVGDLEGKGDLRIEVYNSYGRTKDPALSPITPDDFAFAADEQFTITFTLSGLDEALAGESAETEAPATTTAAETTAETTTTTTAATTTTTTTTTTAATTTTTTTTTTEATTTTTEAATTTTEETTATTEETTTVAEETETEESAEETTTTTAQTTTTTTTTTAAETEAETTAAATTTAAPVTTAAVEQAVVSDNFASRNSSLMIFAIAAGVIIVAVIVAFVIIAIKKKK